MLNRKEIVQLDEERKAAMVSNLMVVLCGEKAATSVLAADEFRSVNGQIEWILNQQLKATDRTKATKNTPRQKNG